MQGRGCGLRPSFNASIDQVEIEKIEKSKEGATT